MASTRELLEQIAAGDVEAARATLAARPTLAGARDAQGVSVLLWAVYHGEEELARELADRLTEIDVFAAAALGDVGRLRALLAQDPGLVRAVSPDGFHPLALTAFFGREEAVAALLDAGADVDATAPNPMAVRALHGAAAHRRPEVGVAIARRLLAAGADPNAVQAGGYTPLHQAAHHGRVELVRELLGQGADHERRDDAERTPLDHARAAGHEAVVRLLEGDGC